MKLKQWILILYEHNFLNEEEVSVLVELIKNGLNRRHYIDSPMTPYTFIDECFHWGNTRSMAHALTSNKYWMSELHCRLCKSGNDIEKLYKSLNNKGVPEDTPF